MSGGFYNTLRKDDPAALAGNMERAFNPKWGDRRTAPPKLEGTKYSRYGERPEGLASMLDREIVERHLLKEQQNVGKGFVQLKAVGADNAMPLNIGGRMFYPDAEGNFTIIDDKAIDIIYQREKERKEYIMGILEKASQSDEICALMFGCDERGLLDILGPNGRKSAGSGLTDEVLAVDARPSALETYAEDSVTYSRAIQKFKYLLMKKMPIINNLTPAKAQNAD